MKKKILSTILALVMLLALVPTTVFAAVAEPDVTVSKTATSVDGMVNAWNVELKVTAKSTTTAGTANDVVLVIDNSNSMYEKNIRTGEINWQRYGWWVRPVAEKIDRMTIAKLAAKEFIDQVITDGGNSRVAIVVFGTGIAATKDFTDNKTELNSFIDSIKQYMNSDDGGTNIQAGINKAAAMLSGRDGNMKNIVVLADGDPTRYYDKDNHLKGPGNATDDATKKATIDAANAAKENNTLYTVAFAAGTSGTQVMNSCASSSETAFAVNSETDVAKLADVFSEIAGSITTTCKNASVEDVMGEGFVVHGDATTANGTVSVSEDGKTINWNIGDVIEPEMEDGVPTGNYVATLHYTVYLDEGIYDAQPNEDGLYAVNESAVLSYNGEETMEFPVPEVQTTAMYMAKLVDTEEGGTFEVKVTNEESGELWGTAELTAIPVTEDMTEEEILNAVMDNMIMVMETVPAGSYVVEEVGAEDEYNVSYLVAFLNDLVNGDADIMESDTFSLAECEDVVVIVVNEKIEVPTPTPDDPTPVKPTPTTPETTPEAPVKSGDTAHMGLYIVLALLAVAAVAVMVIAPMKKHGKRQG